MVKFGIMVDNDGAFGALLTYLSKIFNYVKLLFVEVIQ